MTDGTVTQHELEAILALSQGLKLLWAVLACVAIFVLLRLRDRLIGVRFREVAARIAQDPLAAAIYYGAAVLGLSLLLAGVMGR